MTRREYPGGTVLIRLSANHFAFLRGYLEGLELGALARRYLETAVAPDPEGRAARSALRWIREQLVMAARRRGQLQEARLILLDPEQLRAAPARAVPSLEEFRDERDPHELLSEAELIALFHEEYGTPGISDRRSLRNQRLRRRQLQALLTLETLLGTPPSAQDGVGGWFRPQLAARLQAAGLGTLGQLAAAIEARGYRWWTKVPRVGRVAGAQITAWFRTEAVEQALGVRFGPQAFLPPARLAGTSRQLLRAPRTAIVPLEFLLLPPALDGSAGTNRGRANQLTAHHDIAAIQSWLAGKPEGSSTWRAYRKEAERFLLWATLERGRPLSSLSAEDCRAYCVFLETVGTTPATARWCSARGARGTRRWSPAWRPFEGPLSAASRQQAKVILSGLCRWLTQQGYLARNPWPDTPQPAPRPSTPAGFSDMHWACLEAALDSRASLSTDGKPQRLRLALALCRETGMRLSELVRAKVGDLTGPRPRLQLSAPLLQALDAYLHQRGAGSLAQCHPATSLIGRLPAGRNPRPPRRADGPELSAGALYLSLKQFFTEVANTLEDEAPAMAAQLRRASTEWLRRRHAPEGSALPG